MRRLLLNAITAMSLLACLAAIVTWGRSYRTGDQVFVTCGRRTVGVNSEGGSYAFATFLYLENYGVRWSWGSYAKRCGAARGARSLVFFGWTPEQVGAHDIILPQWTVLAMCGPLPAVRFSRWLRRRRPARRRGFEVEPVTQAA